MRQELLFSTCYIHSKLTLFHPDSVESLVKGLAQVHVPDLTKDGFLSLLAIIMFNELILFYSNERYPADKPHTIRKPSLPTRVKFVESRQLAREILLWLDLHLRVETPTEVDVQP